MKKILQREYEFLHKPLNLRSRFLLLLAAACIATALFFPLWKMHLVAPQYSDGLDLYISASNQTTAGDNLIRLAYSVMVTLHADSCLKFGFRLPQVPLMIFDKEPSRLMIGPRKIKVETGPTLDYETVQRGSGYSAGAE